MKEGTAKAVKTAGAVGIVAGTIALALAGGTEGDAVGFVGIGINAAVVIGMIISIFKAKQAQ